MPRVAVIARALGIVDHILDHQNTPAICNLIIAYVKLEIVQMALSNVQFHIENCNVHVAI